MISDEYHTITVFGDAKVGSSSLARQLVDQCFEEDYQVTRDEGIYRKLIEIDQKACVLSIFMSSPTFFHPHSGSENLLCVFSITDRRSFSALQECLRRMEAVNTGALVLVGNKCDLEHQREVSTAEAADLASSFGLKYFEASAKSGVNVEHCFAELVREIRKATLEKEAHDKDAKDKRQCSLS